MSDILVPVIVSVAVTVTLYFLKNASKAESNVLESSASLRMSILYLIIGGAGLIMSILFLLMPVLAQEYSLEIFIVSGIFFVGFGAMSVVIIMWYWNHRVIYNENGLTATSYYGKKQWIAWNEIKRVKYSAFSGLVVVSDSHGNSVKAHQHLVGFVSLVRAMQSQAKKYHFDYEELPLRMLGISK